MNISKNIRVGGKDMRVSIQEDSFQNKKFNGYVFTDGGSIMFLADGSSVEEVRLALMEKINDRMESFVNFHTQILREIQKATRSK